MLLPSLVSRQALDGLAAARRVVVSPPARGADARAGRLVWRPPGRLPADGLDAGVAYRVCVRAWNGMEWSAM